MAGERLIEDLTRHLTCPSCNLILTDPKTLDCLHSFCARCIIKDQEIGVNNHRRFICPECNVVNDFPENEPTKLRSSSYMNALLDFYHAIIATTTSGPATNQPTNCTSCHNLVGLVGFCANCSGMICDECMSAHQTIKYKNHRVIMLKDFTQEDLSIYSDAQLPICKEPCHGNNAFTRRIEYYCQEEGCGRCICRRCFIVYHRKHDILDKEEITQQLREAMEDDLAKLESLPEELEKDLEKSKQNMSRIEKEIEVAKQKVGDAVQALIKKAKNHEETMLKALDKKLKEQKQVHSQQQNDTRQRMKQVEEFRLRCLNMIEKNACEVVSIQKDLKQMCQTILENPAKPPSQSIKGDVTVHYVTNYVICQSIQDMGKIVESLTDQSHCSIEKLKEARYGFVNDIDYVTRNSKGDVSMATRWKRTFLWTKARSSGFDNEKPLKMTRSISVI